MRALGSKAAAQLKSDKAEKAHLIFPSSLLEAQAPELLGQFHCTFESDSFESNLKRVDEKAEADETKDARARRNGSSVKSFHLYHEKDAHLAPRYLLFKAMSGAKITSKKLCIVRGSEADPEWMTKTAQDLVKNHKNSAKLIKEVRVLEGKQLPELGMNLFWNVGKGAASLPRCLMVHYKGDDSTDDVHLAFVGKGITYDTGGLNIKGTGFMESMYGDKGGSTAVIGAMMGCLDLEVKANIVFACAFAENAIGKDAYKPSDILTAMNGLTVEIGNTDAEGRLVLSDTMTYVQRNFKPKTVAYIATLTGASIVALGKQTAGVFATNKDTANDLLKASELANESLWHLPLLDEHRECMKGKYGADLSNLGAYRYGGASQAAAFLERFIEDDREWCHLDIAGPSVFAENDQSGYGAKLLLSYIVQKSS